MLFLVKRGKKSGVQLLGLYFAFSDHGWGVFFCCRGVRWSALVVAAQDGDHLVAGEDAFDNDGEPLFEVGYDLAQGRFFLVDHLGDAPGEDVGFEAAVFFFLDDGQRAAEEGAVVGVVEGGLAVAAAGGEAGGEVAGFDHGDGDAEAADLGAEGLGEALDGELGGGIEALPREAHDATDGAEVDDLATARLSHVGQHGLAEVDTAHEVGAHLEVYLLGGGELEGTADTHAGIVDEDVDAACLASNGVDDGGHLRAVAHVAL